MWIKFSNYLLAI